MSNIRKLHEILRNSCLRVNTFLSLHRVHCFLEDMQMVLLCFLPKANFGLQVLSLPASVCRLIGIIKCLTNYPFGIITDLIAYSVDKGFNCLISLTSTILDIKPHGAKSSLQNLVAKSLQKGPKLIQITATLEPHVMFCCNLSSFG